MALAVWSDTQVLNQLNSGYNWGTQPITYAFAKSVGSMYVDGETGFSELSLAAQAKATLALRLWDDLITNDMSKQSPGSDYTSTSIEFGMASGGVGYAHAYYPNVGSVWFNSEYGDAWGTNNLVSPTIGKHGFMTYIHEIGHSLGLDHMGDYNGSQNSGPSCYQDSTVYSLMSYYGPSWGSGSSAGEGLVAWADWYASDNTRYSPQTPMLNDIMAIQSIYGVETTTRTGNTVYGFNSNITDETQAIYNFSQNAHPILCIFDSEGNDTLDLSGFATSSVINLAPGSFSNCDAMTYNISIAYSCQIENAVGGNAADTINGNALANVLTGNGGNDRLKGLDGNDGFRGGLGNDSIDGGEGSDTCYFTASWSGLTYTYDTLSSTFTFTSATDGTDTVVNAEYFTDASGVAKSLADLTGVVDPGTAGNPSLSITADAASAAEGDSGSTPYSFTVTLSEASTEVQSVTWSAVFGSGAGQADAGDFTGPLSGVVEIAAGQVSTVITLNVAGDTVLEADETFTVSLSNPSGASIAVGDAAGRILNDEAAPLNLSGSTGNDVLTGGDANDRLSGLSGNDTLSGLGGSDVLIGGSGWDSLTGGSGADVFDFDTATQISSVTTTTVKASDVITDFEAGIDKIDFSTIDATNKLTGNNSFTWLGNSALGKQLAGELRFQQFDSAGTANDYTMVYGDTDSDIYMEFALKLTGLVNLSASDFVL